MTSATTQSLLIDQLWTCTTGGSRPTLSQDADKFSIYSSCTATLRARQLNAVLIPELTESAIADVTFPTLKARFIAAFSESVTADEKLGENAGMELTHLNEGTSFTKSSWMFSHFVEGGTSERDLRHERHGQFHPEGCR